MSKTGSLEAAFERSRESGAGKTRDGQRVRRGDEPCVCALAANGTPVEAYNEHAFRYFLNIERKRSQESKRPFVLLLVDLKKQPSGSRIDAQAAQKLMSALSECVRETDFVGWYRDCAVAGAVLTQYSEAVESNLPDAVSRRVMAVLRDRLPADLANMLQVRVYRLPSSQSVSS